MGPVLTWAMGTNTDPSCMDHGPRHSHQQQLGLLCHHEPRWQHVPLRLLWTQQQHGPQTPTWFQVAVEPPLQSHGPWWQQEPRTLTQTLTVVGPWTWTCPTQRTPWQHRPLRSAWPLQLLTPQIPTWPQMVTQKLGILVTFCGNSGHGHKHRHKYAVRPWTQMWPSAAFGSRCHHGPG